MTRYRQPIPGSISDILPRTYLDHARKVRPVSEPLIQGTVFSAETAAQQADLFQSKSPEFYQRFGHPNSRALARKIAFAEGAEEGLAFASGMAAISTVLMSFARADARFVVGSQLFDQTSTLLDEIAQRCGVRVDRVDMRNPAKLAGALKTNATLVYIETPSNPHLYLTDIAAITELARPEGIPVIVDNTFATPLGQRPIELGASLVVHSGTKLLNGHMDAMCGFVAGDSKLIADIESMRRLLGGVLDPHASWLVSRGIKTLGVRTRQIFGTALQVADYLYQRGGVRSVRYPMHPNDPQHAVALKQMTGGGAVIAFSVPGGRSRARAFVDHLQFISLATSLGGTETTIELPYDLDWVERVTNPDGQASFADPGLVRLSIGLETADTLIADLDQALDVIAD